jgi:hypothetical protein
MKLLTVLAEFSLVRMDLRPPRRRRPLRRRLRARLSSDVTFSRLGSVISVAQQHTDRSLSASVRALADVRVADMTRAVDQVLRRPIAVGVRSTFRAGRSNGNAGV